MTDAQNSQNRDKLLAFCFGLAFIATILILALAVPNPTTTQWFVFRVVLALAAAGIGAVIPGLIRVDISTIVRAGGAIALFVVVYSLNPPALVSTPEHDIAQPVHSRPANNSVQPVQQTTHGANSPAIVSQGNVTITSSPTTTAEKQEKK